MWEITTLLSNIVLTVLGIGVFSAFLLVIFAMVSRGIRELLEYIKTKRRVKDAV